MEQKNTARRVCSDIVRDCSQLVIFIHKILPETEFLRLTEDVFASAVTCTRHASAVEHVCGCVCVVNMLTLHLSDFCRIFAIGLL